MKSTILSFIAFLLFIISFSAYAAEVPTGLHATEISDTTISLDWEDTPWALGYYIYYGTKSGSGSKYESEGINLIDTSEYVLEGLLPETRYYIALTSVDDFWTESLYSQELEQVTLTAWSKNEATSFRIKSANVIDSTTLEFIFSTDLDVDAGKTSVFVVEEKNTWKEVSIDLSQVNENNKRSMLVLLGENLLESTEYKVTVLDIKDAQWNTIESGIDAFLTFTTPSWLKKEEVSVPQAVPEDSVVSEQDESTQSDLNAAGSPDEVKKSQAWNAGETLPQDDVLAGTMQTAAGSEKLPQTGAEHWILLILSLFLAWGVYFIHNRKIIFKK